MTDLPLTDAIAEVKPEGTFVLFRDGWPMDVFAFRQSDHKAIEMIPATDAKLAVAEALRMAGSLMREIMADSLNVPISHDELVGTLDTAILALADTDALAEVMGMHADIATLRACAKAEMERAEAAEAKLAAQERVQHVKRGSTYRVLGRGKVQTDTPLTDYAEVVVYQGEADGLVWVRPVSEFDDGRFAALAAAKAPSHGSGEGE